jgi:hypothetical protein
MTTMERIADLAKRIRWRSVIALILFVAVLFVLFKSMPGSYQVLGAVGIRVTADPSTVAPGGSSVLDVELKNVNAKEAATVTFKAQTTDRNIYFEDSNSQTYGSASISIGPQETRKIKLKVKTKTEALEGQYTLDFSALPQGEDKGPETRVTLTVEKAS